MKNREHWLLKVIGGVSALAVLGMVLGAVVKGERGSGLEQAGELVNQGEVFESSISRGRYALTLSLTEEGRWDYSQEKADFAAPDAAMADRGKLVSIWPPGVAVVAAPFYLLGKQLGAGQLAVGLSQVLLAGVCMTLIYRLTVRVGLPKRVGFFSALLFIFASNALAYTVVLAQHLLTTAVVLGLLNVCLAKRSAAKQVVFWSLYGAGIMIDIPNVALMLPIAGYLIFTDLIEFRESGEEIGVRVNYGSGIAAGLIILAWITMMGYYNYLATGSVDKIGQLLPRYTVGKLVENEVGGESDGILEPLSVEKMPMGLGVLLFGWERGLLTYFPVFLLGVFGLKYLFEKNRGWGYLFAGFIVTNFSLYAMFGDVWGGWAFGPRYVIPALALMSVLVGAALASYYKKMWFELLIIGATIYSVLLAILGALTTTLIPPAREAAGYGLDATKMVMVDYLREKKLDSYIYKNYLSGYLSGIEFYEVLCGVILAVMAIAWVGALYSLKKNEK